MMKLLDLTLDSPAENVAMDEALLDAAEADPADHGEVLRLWEPREMMVVVGNSSRLSDEVNSETCARNGIPVLRRASGGAAILTGPGCLMYAVVLSYRARPQLRSIDQAHQFVLSTIATALDEKLSRARGERDQRSRLYDARHAAQRAGISDLVIENKKFSGNSLRCKRNFFIYHGTLLHGFSLEKIGEFLKQPPRQPDYREQRSHRDFVANLPLDAATIRQTLITAFNATEKLAHWPRTLTAQLIAEKYGRPDWNKRL
jgi:lipoate---protein ligase